MQSVYMNISGEERVLIFIRFLKGSVTLSASLMVCYWVVMVTTNAFFRNVFASFMRVMTLMFANNMLK